MLRSFGIMLAYGTGRLSFKIDPGSADGQRIQVARASCIAGEALADYILTEAAAGE